MDDALVYHVERLDHVGVTVSISGWAFVREKCICSVLAYSEGGRPDRVRGYYGFLRNDIGDAHGKHHANSAFIIPSLILIEPSRVFLEFETTCGERIRTLLNMQASGVGPETGEERPVGLRSFFQPVSEPQNHARYFPAIEANTPKPAAKPASSVPVSIFSSIYKGREYLDGFFDSLQNRTHGYDEIVLVDNGNYEKDLIEYIDRRAKLVKNCTLVTLKENRGYIAGICAAYAARRFNGHAVVINTDVVFPPDWLDRLIWPLNHSERVASVTPFTNAGTCCSFPLTAVDNEIFLGLDVAEIDRHFSELIQPENPISLPSGVGFCMALHADMLEKIGWFDYETFGFGYGEENDWCLKAEKIGWRNVLAHNLFVYHKHGGIYPSSEKRALIERNLSVITQRFPYYGSTVERYFKNDPSAGLRAIVAYRIAANNSQPPREITAINVRDSVSTDTKHPYIIIAQDDNSLLWQAILDAEGWRDHVWGWGQLELDALLNLLNVKNCFQLRNVARNLQAGSGYTQATALTLPPTCA